MGNKLDGGTLTEGSGTLNYYRDSGQLETSFTYKDGAINGHIVHYYSSKEIMEQGNYFSFRDTTMPPIDINLDRYEDYNIKAAHQLIMKSGTSYSTFDKKGTIESSIKAANNLLSDTILITDFNENKTYSSRGSLVYGSKIGIYERYNEVGTIESKINYKLAYDSIRWWFSVKDGKALFYHENSFLKAEIWYENDKEVGESFYYNDNGQLVRTRILYPNGSSINIFKGDTVNYTDSAGRKQGKWLSFEIYSCSETPTEIQYYKNDNPCDVWTSYSDGIISGKKYWIDSTYCDSEWYFANGRLRAKGKWKYDYFFGKWKWYHEKTGELEKEGFHGWSKNWTMEKQGEWIIYNKKGRPKRIEYYIDGELEATRRP